MKALLVAALIAYAYAAPAATQSEIDADKPIIENLVKTLKDSSQSAEQKQTAFANALNSLQGPYKDQFNTLVANIKDAVNNISSPTAKAAAEKFVSLWDNGTFFGSAESIKSEAGEILNQLSDADKQTLKDLKKKFGTEFKETFKDIMPAHAAMASDNSSQ